MTPELQHAVQAVLARAVGSLRPGSERLTSRYRGGGTSAGIDHPAYLAARLPATYAAVFRVLSELHVRRPHFAPESLLDVGAGPGTASWAAQALWPGLAAITMTDNDKAFLALARRLAGMGPGPLATARFIERSMTAELPTANLVIAAYALAEVADHQQGVALASLCRAADGVLVLVEPGTPAGFQRLRRARQWLLAEGGIAVAPCTHYGACPLVGNDWCHFSVRLARSRAHMHAKRATTPFEDEKYAYLIMAREGAASGGGRVLAPPEHSKAGVTLKLCTPAGLESRRIASRDRLAYKAHSKTGWGERIDS